MYNYYNPNQQTTQQMYRMPMVQPAGLKGRPVASVEEARAATIDFDGSIFFFPDVANKKIYTKQINIDGTMLMNMYELKEIQTPVAEDLNPNLYITREEFENTIAQLKNALSANITSVDTTGAETTAREFKF